MKFYLDENFPPGILDSLRLIYHDHEFRSWHDEELMSEKDIPLFGILRDRGFDFLLTRDRMQLQNPAEKAALARSGLIWVGIKDAKLSGRQKLATTTASLLAGLEHVLEDSPGTPVYYMVNNVPHGKTQRVRTFELSRG